jgi:hypothetical protein
MTKAEKIKLLYTNVKRYHDTMSPFWNLFEEIPPLERGWEDTLQDLTTLLEIDEGLYDIIFDFAFEDTITLTIVDEGKPDEIRTFTNIDELAEFLA